MTVPAASPRTAWLIVVGCFVGVAVSVAPAYMTVLGLFIKPMAAETGLSRTQLSSVPSLMALVAAICSPFVGGLIDRWGSRRVALAGVVMLPLGLVAHAFAGGSLPVFLAVAVFMGVAASVACPLPYISALPHWFDRRLGLAIALSMAGIGFGEIVLPRYAAGLIAAQGWRTAWLILAATILVVGLGNLALLFRDRPHRDRAAVDGSATPAPAESGTTWRSAVRQPAFWLLGLAAALVAQVGVGMMVHTVPLLSDRGFSTATAATAIAALGVGSLAGRLTTGLALDRFGIAPVGAGLFALQGLGMIALWSGGSALAMSVAVFFVGLAVGAETDIIPFAVRRLFGLRAFGRIYGMAYGLFSLGPVLGPLLMGASFDRAGSYGPAMLWFAASSGIAALCIAAVGRLSRTREG